MFMAQQKMQCDVQRTHGDNQNAIVGGKCYSLKKPLRHDDLRASSKDYEIPTLNSRNSDKRYAVLTLLPESGGLWRIVAPALEYLDHSNLLESGAQVNMDGLHMVSPSPINAFNVDERKAWKGTLRDVTYSIKSFSPRNFPGSDVKHQSHSRTLNSKVAKFHGRSIDPASQGSITCRNSPGLIPQRSNSWKSSDIFVENPKGEKGVRRNLRKKARKKGKQNKKLPRDAVSAEPEVFSEDYGHGLLVSEACRKHNMDQVGGLLPYATSRADSLSDSRVNIIDLEGNNSGIISSSESPKTCTSYIDEVDLSEAKISSTIKNLTWGRPAIDPEISLPVEDHGLPIVDGGVPETRPLEIICCEGIHLNGFSDIHLRILDSVSVSSNSDNSTVTSCDAKLGDKERNEISQSELADFDPRKGYFSFPNSLSSVVDFYEFTEGARHGNQAFSSSDVQVAALGKKGKQAKMVPRSSSAYKLGSVGNLCGRTGKENNRVWQKVQKNSAKESNSEFKKVHPVGAQTLKDASLVRRNSSVADVDMSSKTKDKKRLKDKTSRKMKRKTSPGSKQEHKSYYHRATYPSKVSSNNHEKIAVHQNDVLNISTQGSEHKRLNNFPRSHSQFGCPELGFQKGAAEPLNFKLFKNSQDCHENLDLHGSVYNTVSGVKEQNQDRSLVKSCCTLDKLNLLPVQYLPHLLVNDIAQSEVDISLAEHSKQSHSSGSHLQKWIPIGNKDPCTTTSTRCGSLSSGNSDGQGAAENWTLRNNIDENAVTNSQNPISLLDIGMISPPLSSDSSSSQEDENYTLKLKNTIARTLKEKNSKHVIADCLISESKDQNSSAVKTDLNNIVQAVNHACRMQLASEAVQIASGGPIAEFERLLHFSSPVICRLPNLRSCEICSQNQVSGAFLCRHETPNISLEHLWQWYEELGSYGLEIRAEDYEHSNRLGVDRFSFRAYFVPFLSAVQLFRDSKSHSTNNSNAVSTYGVLETCETGETFQSSSDIGRLPIFSLLVPQPRRSDASSLPPEKEVSKSELSSASAKGEFSSDDMRGSNDVELLFEFFESEQPWQRQPLYEKIQELIQGDGPSQCKMYGDPTNLNSINLQDLHPASWYSVAWYPIYRIPDGNFRAAFLTYHSLGHIIHRRAKVDSAETCIVSPVVGLQSYHAQSECWFQLKHYAQSQTIESSGLSPSGILKDRLKSLEETASIMSRAVVRKGNQTSVNKQPDYEFFVSRQRCS